MLLVINLVAETDTTLNSTQETLVIEEEEKKMLKEEMELTVMLQKYQEKHKNVKLVYEKVIENIKAMTKFEKKNEKIQGDNNETINLTQTVTTSNMLDSQLIDNSNSMNFFSNQINEEELLKSYYDFLETTKKTMEMLFLCHSKKEFLNLMKEKGYEVQSQNFRANAKRESISSMKAASFTKRTVKEIQNLEPTNRTDAEYDYEDEEIRMDEEKIKKVTAEMIKSYKENVKFFVIQ